MKLTDDQLAELRSRIFQRDPGDAVQIAEHLAPLIEGWMSAPTDDAVGRLEEIAEALSDDCEAAHSEADDVILRCVPAEVVKAYRSVVASCEWWAYA